MTNIKEQSDEVLKRLLDEKSESLRSFRFGISGSRTRNVREGRNTRKEIARIKTEINSRSSKNR